MFVLFFGFRSRVCLAGYGAESDPVFRRCNEKGTDSVTQYNEVAASKHVTLLFAALPLVVPRLVWNNYYHIIINKCLSSPESKLDYKIRNSEPKSLLPSSSPSHMYNAIAGVTALVDGGAEFDITMVVYRSNAFRGGSTFAL